MPWTLTRDLDEFLTAAGEHLRAEPVLHTVPLTVLDRLTRRGTSTFGDDAPVYGWHGRADGPVDGAFFQTPPFPVLVTTLPAGSAADLIRRLTAAAGLPAAINMSSTDEPDFGAAWAQATGGGATAAERSRLFRLDRLVHPQPAPPGAARVASHDDRALLVEWFEAFGQEAGTFADNAARTVDDRLSHGGLTLWEAGGSPVAMAGNTLEVAGVVRIGPVYTPPAHRQRGYGGAATAAVSQAAIDAGASAVVLFTDLANPTSNALYRRLGYRPVCDRVLLHLAHPGATVPDSTGPDSAGRDVTPQAPSPS